ncbi:MAG: hypothetical protein LBM00_01755 [Deltaproteobacteria bacterium]|jgi:hypothetical protein|nr:hypothetical protein [Deltaproteobacteria bacterium]
MIGLLKSSVRSFEARLFAGVLLCSLLAVSLGLLFEIARDRRELLRFLEERSGEKAELLRLMADEPLRKGDDAGMREIFAALADEFPESVFSMAGIDGMITYSTSAKEVKEPFSRTLRREPAEIYKQGLESGAGAGPFARLLEDGGRRKLMLVAPIENRPECYHCHGWSNSMLGASAVLTDVEGELSAFFWESFARLGFWQFGALLLTLALFVFLRRRPGGKSEGGEEEKAEFLRLVPEARSLLREHGAAAAELAGQIQAVCVLVQRARDALASGTADFAGTMDGFGALLRNAAAAVQGVGDSASSGQGAFRDGSILMERMRRCASVLPELRQRLEDLAGGSAKAAQSLLNVQELAKRVNFLALTALADVGDNAPGALLKMAGVLHTLYDDIVAYEEDMRGALGWCEAGGREALERFESVRRALEPPEEAHMENLDAQRVFREKNPAAGARAAAALEELAGGARELRRAAGNRALEEQLLQILGALAEAEATTSNLAGVSERLQGVLYKLEDGVGCGLKRKSYGIRPEGEKT